MKKQINVLMSTYNGEKYLREQLDSILGQKDVNLRLFIRDDGSSDATRDIISEYVCNNANIVFINETSRENYGFNKSFYSLIEKAIELDKDTQLFAFADQDDVWMPDKLSSAIRKIDARLEKCKKLISDIPIYYFANKNWTDEQLNIQHQDDMRFCKDDYFDMFMLPPVYGCASVFNRKLAELTLQGDLVEKGLLYDVYMYRITCLVGGICISDKTPCMLYRRHGKNASGDAMKLSPLTHLYKKMFHSTSFHGMQKYVSDIFENYTTLIPEEQGKLCEHIIKYNSSIRDRVKLILWKKAYSRGPKAAIMWIGRILMNAI